MERYDELYRLYDEFDTETLRDHQRFVDLLPAIDSQVGIEHWEDAQTELGARKREIREAFPTVGDTLAEVAARVTRDEAFTALDLLAKHERAVNVLVLDVDETLRSAGNTDNEIPRDTLHRLTEFHEAGVPIVVCTGQTLENVKGFAIQGLGNAVVHSGDVSIVYEAGTGVFTPGHGAETKQLLFEELSEEIRAVFDRVRSRVLSEAPEEIRRCTHLQGNEFNVTLKPNFETGSADAERIVDRALVYEIDLLGESVVAEVSGGRLATADDADAAADGSGAATETVDESDGDVPASNATDGSDGDREVSRETAHEWARAYYAAADPEIHAVLTETVRVPGIDASAVPTPVRETFERIDVAYYEADAAEIGSLELNKVVGVERAFEVLGVADPFAAVLGDSKSDLRVMEWVAESEGGIAAAPNHASQAVLDHVRSTDGLVFDRGDAASMLATIEALNRLASLDE